MKHPAVELDAPSVSLSLQQECYLLCVVEQGVGGGETMEQRGGVGKL